MGATWVSSQVASIQTTQGSNSHLQQPFSLAHARAGRGKVQAHTLIGQRRCSKGHPRTLARRMDPHESQTRLHMRARSALRRLPCTSARASFNAVPRTLFSALLPTSLQAVPCFHTYNDVSPDAKRPCSRAKPLPPLQLHASCPAFQKPCNTPHYPPSCHENMAVAVTVN